MPDPSSWRSAGLMTIVDIRSARAIATAASANLVIVLMRLSLLNLTGGWWRMTKP
ncbi:hypothetical protein [Shinella sp.]|uniref:hypothetical protein n=1 Tax=Shinella sp. TaxID=1870904 RepID=UPI0039E5A286